MVVPAVGVVVGLPVGLAVGSEVGASVGLVVGPEVEATVGSAVGDVVGPPVGTLVGPVEGATVGRKVGPTDGVLVGPTVGGIVVGPSLGLVEGLVVGPNVGSPVAIQHELNIISISSFGAESTITGHPGSYAKPEQQPQLNPVPIPFMQESIPELSLQNRSPPAPQEKSQPLSVGDVVGATVGTIVGD